MANFDDLRNDASGNPNPGDPTGSDAEIEARIISRLSNFSTVVNDLDSIPVTAQARSNSFAFSPDDIEEYLLQGGLIAHPGGPGTQKVSAIEVYVLLGRNWDDSLTFEAYIEDNSS